jgi:hypothetical protein
MADVCVEGLLDGVQVQLLLQKLLQELAEQLLLGLIHFIIKVPKGGAGILRAPGNGQQRWQQDMDSSNGPVTGILDVMQEGNRNTKYMDNNCLFM